MHYRRFYFHFRDRTKYYPHILAFLWIIGVLLGMIIPAITRHTDPSFGRLYLTSYLSSGSAVGLLLVPFLVSAVCIYFDLPWICFPLAFLKAFCFGYCFSSVFLSFHQAGWLVALLLLPCNMLENTVFLVFTSQHIPEKRKDVLFWTVICSVFLALSFLLYQNLAIPVITVLLQYI